MNQRNQNKTLSGFSLVEVLVTLGIVAIVASLIMNAYKGIQNSAIAVAQQKDQSELNQVMAELRMSGGNLAAIANSLTNGSTATATDAPTFYGSINSGASGLVTVSANLTYLLQNPVTGNSKTQKGTIGGQALSPDEYLIPFPYSATAPGNPATAPAGTTINTSYTQLKDARNRIVFHNGVPSISTTGMGFILVNKNTSSDWSNFFYTSNNHISTYGSQWNSIYQAPTTATAAQTSNPMGSKNATSQAYVWDQDSAVYNGPTSNGGGGSPSGYSMSYTTAFTGSVLGGSSFNLAEYRGSPLTSGGTTYTVGATPATVYVFAFLTKDGQTVTQGSSPGDLSFVAPTVPDATSPVSFDSPTKLWTSTPGTLSTLCNGLGSVATSVKGQLETGGQATDSTYGTLMKLQLCQYTPAPTDAFTAGFFPNQWSNATMAIVAQVNGAPADTTIQVPVVRVSTTPIPLDPLGAPIAPPGGVYNAATHTLDLTGAASGATFTLPPSGTGATYGGSDYTVDAVDGSSGITLSGEGTGGVTFQYTTP